MYSGHGWNYFFILIIFFQTLSQPFAAKKRPVFRFLAARGEFVDINAGRFQGKAHRCFAGHFHGFDGILGRLFYSGFFQPGFIFAR